MASRNTINADGRYTYNNNSNKENGRDKREREWKQRLEIKMSEEESGLRGDIPYSFEKSMGCRRQDFNNLNLSPRSFRVFFTAVTRVIRSGIF